MNSTVDLRESMQKAFEKDCAHLRPELMFTLTHAGTYLYEHTRTAFQIYRLGYVCGYTVTGELVEW